MLRITPHLAQHECLLKLEGCLTDDWVPELEACWRVLTMTAPNRRVRVDLTDVSRVDAAGRVLLTAMYCAGVAFLATGFVMPDLLQEISQAVDCERRH